ncbi:MAG: polysaccharide biosynthesis/export family protein [Candidatus Velthaea sp.]
MSTLPWQRPVFVAVLIALATTPALAKLHPGDRVAVLVYNHPELSGQSTVDGSGNISLPLAGGVDTTNLDPSQVAQKVRYRLQPYVRKVAVDVQLLAQGQSVFVSGGPGGVLAYSPGENLSGALAQLRAQTVPVNNTNAPPGQQVTSDFDFDHGRIDLQHVGVIRDDRLIGSFDATTSGLGTGGSAVLQPGDTIQLRNKPVSVTVRGDVKQPGVAYLDATESMSAALTQAGGELPTSATNNIILERGGVRHTVALGSPEFSQPAQSGDVILVPRAPTISVVGMVVKPGDVLLRNDTTLLSALYSADGIQKWADLRKVHVLSHGQSTTYDVTRLTHGDVSQNPALSDGDTVFVPEGHKIDWTPVFAALGTAVGLANRFIPLHYIP